MKNHKAFGYRLVDLVLVSSLSGFDRYETALIAAERNFAASGVRFVSVAKSLGL